MSFSVYLVALTLFINSNVDATGYNKQFCEDLKPQNTLDIGQIMGMWYGVEVIPHLREEEGEVNYDSCPVIHLSESTHENHYPQNDYDNQFRHYGRYYDTNYQNPLGGSDNLRPGDYGYNWNSAGGNAYGSGSYGAGSYDSQRSSLGSSYGSHSGSYGSHDYNNRDFRHIRLYWDENLNNKEYHLKFNSSRRGFWIMSGSQDISQGAIHSQYNEFGGTVQVLKAVSDHLVLTFCQRDPELQLFSTILSREPQQLSRQVIHSIHSLLNRRDLSTTSVHRVCRNGSVNMNPSTLTMAAFTLLSLLVYFGIGKF